MPVRALQPILQPTSPTLPELLAPAGNWEMLRVGLACGADAVYFGLDEGFNARARADNFKIDEIEDIVDEVHRAGARALVTMNTLIFERELQPVADIIARLAAAGVDALIVQDPAVCLLAGAIAPDMELHASTQMTISSVEGIEFARSLGCCKVVVPRELSVSEIAALRDRDDMQLETFIHGALCVSWSGQCLSSEAWGGRSANRGQCAQACRLPYDLIIDGEEVPSGDVRYFLSPKDLAGHRAVPALMMIGVETLKIEGRLKSPEFVETAVRSLRRWIDSIAEGDAESPEAQRTLSEDLKDASVAYSRGFSDGFLGGSDHQLLVDGTFPRSRGYLLGTVVSVNGYSVTVERASSPDVQQLDDRRGRLLSPLPDLGASGQRANGPKPAPLQPERGMGVAFDAGNPQDQNEPGGPIFGVENVDDGWKLTFGKPGPRLGKVKPGHRVWATSSPSNSKAARRAATANVPGGRPLRFAVSGELGAPLVATATVGKQTATVQSQSPLESARSGGIDRALLEDKLGALGGTAFRLAGINLRNLKPGLHLRVSELKSMRRELVDVLTPQVRLAARRSPKPVDVDGFVADRRSAATDSPHRQPMTADAHANDTANHLEPIVLCRTAEQLEAVIAAGLKHVELDWMEMVALGKSVEKARAAGLHVTLATTRVQKPGEEGFDRRIANLNPDAVLVRHWGAVTHFSEQDGEPEGDPSRPAVHGDFSLNVTNSVTANELLARGLDTITAAHDLDKTQLQEMLENVDAQRVTVVIHHHIPTFHTEHCVYAMNMGDGLDYRTCGRPCDDHRIALRDQTGDEHPIVVDVGCRNTMFNARAQSATSILPELQSAGVRRFRIEFVWESKREALDVIEGYRALLRGDIDSKQLTKRLNVHEQFGVTLGTMRTLR